MKMKILLVLIAVCCSNVSAQTISGKPKRIFSEPFGTVQLYYPASDSGSMIIFISGDAGWNFRMVKRAQKLAEQGIMVAGVNILHYFRYVNKPGMNCMSPGPDLEKLGNLILEKTGKSAAIHPVLAGYSSGATLVYVAAAQKPQSFAGIISLGFCPEMFDEMKFCSKFPGDTIFVPEPLSVPWYIIQGKRDRICPASGVETFLQKVYTPDVYMINNAGHLFFVKNKWVPKCISAYKEITAEK